MAGKIGYFYAQKCKLITVKIISDNALAIKEKFSKLFRKYEFEKDPGMSGNPKVVGKKLNLKN